MARASAAPVPAAPSRAQGRRACRIRADPRSGAGRPAWRCPRVQWPPPARIPGCSRASAIARAGAADAPRSATHSWTSLPVFTRGRTAGHFAYGRRDRTAVTANGDWWLALWLTPMLPCRAVPLLWLELAHDWKDDLETRTQVLLTPKSVGIHLMGWGRGMQASGSGLE
ncbi:protein of unknown function (plasmid) [Cupriavidus taiwanensis]|uniref:Uncharacterized protein n=1 Tax=Cupriavidus taiwanensis TaxID=164546 RepID=A0A375IQD7_9BURK|nr:protein of unknown function [Cupriavidus taiwanensis]